MQRIMITIFRILTGALGVALLLAGFLVVFLLPSGLENPLAAALVKTIAGIVLLGSGVFCLAFSVDAGRQMGWKHRVMMRLWQFSGVVLLIYAADHLVLVILLMTGRSDFATVFIQGILAMVFWRTGIFSLQRGRKHRAVNALELAKADPRPAVLYLRPFHDDQTTGQVAGTPLLGMHQFILGSRTEEEQMKEVLEGIGPFKALGRPGERLPELGAARKYVDDAVWEQRIQEEMSQAGLVLIRVGTAKHLIIEAELAVRQLQPDRLVLLIPGVTEHYRGFRAKTQGLFPQDLPEGAGLGGDSQPGSLAALVYFNHDWTPHWVPLAAPPRLSTKNLLSRGRPLAPRLIAGFAPVFHRLGISLPRLRVSWGLTLVHYAVWLIITTATLFFLWVVYSHFFS